MQNIVVTKIAFLNSNFWGVNFYLVSLTCWKIDIWIMSRWTIKVIWNWQKNIFEPTQIHTSFKVIGYYLGWNFCLHQCCILFSIQNQTKAENMNLEAEKRHLRTKPGWIQSFFETSNWIIVIIVELQSKWSWWVVIGQVIPMVIKWMTTITSSRMVLVVINLRLSKGWD